MRFWQPVAPEGLLQSFFDTGKLLVFARLDAERKTRMIIQYRKRITTTRVHGQERPFKVHLPELVWAWILEALPWPLGAGMSGIKPSVASQDIGDGAGSRQALMSEILKPTPQLAPSPVGMFIA